MDDQQFELIMEQVKGVRTDLKLLNATVLSHDRDIRAVKVIGKFLALAAVGTAGVVTFYETVLQVLNLRK